MDSSYTSHYHIYPICHKAYEDSSNICSLFSLFIPQNILKKLKLNASFDRQMKIFEIFCLHTKAVVNGNGIDTSLSSYDIPYDFEVEIPLHCA